MKYITKQLAADVKTELQNNYFRDQLNKCGNDPKSKWKLIRKFWPDNKELTKINNINGKESDKDIGERINSLVVILEQI